MKCIKYAAIMLAMLASCVVMSCSSDDDDSNGSSGSLTGGIWIPCNLLENENGGLWPAFIFSKGMVECISISGDLEKESSSDMIFIKSKTVKGNTIYYYRSTDTQKYPYEKVDDKYFWYDYKEYVTLRDGYLWSNGKWRYKKINSWSEL